VFGKRGYCMTVNSANFFGSRRGAMPATAKSPLGRSFGIAIAPKGMVAGWDITPFDQHLIAVETLGRLGVVIPPRGDRTALGRPRHPYAPCSFGSAHVGATRGREGVQVSQPNSELYAYRAGEKSGQQVLHIGS
jgi:hypothetical protein